MHVTTDQVELSPAVVESGVSDDLSRGRVNPEVMTAISINEAVADCRLAKVATHRVRCQHIGTHRHVLQRTVHTQRTHQSPSFHSHPEETTYLFRSIRPRLCS